MIEKPYDRERAVQYARRWAFGRNPLFADFSDLGGDCTNFVSQCVLAGSCVMNYTRDFGWYYINDSDRAPAWSGVGYFFEFLTEVPRFTAENGGTGPFGKVAAREEILPGDVIQYANEQGRWSHSLIVSEIRGSEILVCAHSVDARDRALSSYEASDFRYLHIEGIRFVQNTRACFDYLIGGGKILSLPGSESNCVNTRFCEFGGE